MTYKTKEQKTMKTYQAGFPWTENKEVFCFTSSVSSTQVLTGIWNPLISAQIINSFGQRNCTFDCQSGNLKNYASGNHLSTSSCMLRIEILITFNITCMWTFHTNSLFHEYSFLMHVQIITINTFINDLVFFTVTIQC